MKELLVRAAVKFGFWLELQTYKVSAPDAHSQTTWEIEIDPRTHDDLLAEYGA